MRLTSTWMRLALAPTLVFIATATDTGFLCDFWHHLARGRAMAEERRLVDTDRFTFTVTGQAFEDVNWLPQLLYHRLYERGGLPLVQLVNSAVLALAMLGLVLLCWKVSESAVIAGALGVYVFFGIWQSLTIRPQTFSFLLFVCLYILLERSDRRPWLLLLTYPLMALWSNVHGAFPAGLLLIGSFWAAAAWDAWRTRGRTFLRVPRAAELTVCLVAAALATLVNPYGWRVYHFVANTSSVATARPIGEWLPPSTDLLIGKFWAASLVLLLVAFALPRSRPGARDVFLVVCFLPPACAAVRMVPWWVIVTAPVLARLLAANFAAGWSQAEAERPSYAPAACFAAMIAACILSVPPSSRFNPLLPPTRRVRQTETDLDQVAAALAARGSSARLFSRFEWASYLTCRLGTTFAVFMDTRIDMFPDDVWSDYAALTAGRADWQTILDRRHVDYLVLDAHYHAESGLFAQVACSPAWQEAARAGSAVLFARR